MLDLLAGLTVGLHLASVHVPAADWQNNANVGIYAKTAGGITAGIYRNTQHRTSVYAGYTLEHGPFALTLGAITGYSARPVMPMLAPSVALPALAGITPRLTFIPKFGAVKAAALHLSIEATLP